MDRAGQRPTQLTNDELIAIFEAFDHTGGNEGRNEARLRLSSRNRTTVFRAYNIVSDFESRGLESIDDDAADRTADAARYSTTRSYVQKVFQSWRAWKKGGRQPTSCNEHRLVRRLHQEVQETFSELSLEKLLPWLALRLDEQYLREILPEFSEGNLGQDHVDALYGSALPKIEDLHESPPRVMVPVEQDPLFPLMQQHVEHTIPVLHRQWAVAMVECFDALHRWLYRSVIWIPAAVLVRVAREPAILPDVWRAMCIVWACDLLVSELGERKKKSEVNLLLGLKTQRDRFARVVTTLDAHSVKVATELSTASFLVSESEEYPQVFQTLFDGRSAVLAAYDNARKLTSDFLEALANQIRRFSRDVCSRC